MAEGVNFQLRKQSKNNDQKNENKKQITENKVNEGWRDPLFLWDLRFKNFSDSDCFLGQINSGLKKAA